MKRRLPILRTWLLMVIGAFILLAGCGAQQFQTNIFQDFYSLGWGPTAMTWNGRDLIIGDQTMVMELVSIETGRFVSDTFPYNSNGFFNYSRQPQSIRAVARISGLAWEGDCCNAGYLWVADSQNKQIVKLSTSHDVLKVFATRGFSPQGLAFDGKDVWTIDAAASRIYKLSSENGAVLSVFTSPISQPLALAWDCEHLIVLGIDNCKTSSADCLEKKLYKMDVKTGRIVEEIGMPRQIKRPSSIAVNKDILWIGDKILNRVFKVSNSGSSVEETKTYLIAKSPTEESRPRKIEIMESSPAQPKPDDSKKSADEAKEAAEKAKKSADEAKEAAEKAKKAFELQQKK